MKIMLPKIKIDIERWKYNKDFEIYVSTKGRIKDKNKILLPVKVDKSGYLLFVTQKHTFKSVHRIVMETWHPRKDMDRLTIDHNNHNKRDNSLSNLEWISEEENQLRAHRDLVNTEEADTSENMGTPIISCNGSKIFTSFDDIGIYLLDKKKIPLYNNDNKTTIKKNVIKAIKNKTKYCGCIFDIR